MTEKSFPFDSVRKEDGIPDRVYKSKDFADYYNSLMTTGLIHENGKTGFNIENNSGLSLTIGTGTAFINGRYYISEKQKTFTFKTTDKHKVDLIILRCDLRTDYRNIRLVYLNGTESDTEEGAKAPNHTRSSEIYDLPLYAVRHTPNAITIDISKITDYRGRAVICPLSNPKAFGGVTVFRGKETPNSKVVKAGDIWLEELL